MEKEEALELLQEASEGREADTPASLQDRGSVLVAARLLPGSLVPDPSVPESQSVRSSPAVDCNGGWRWSMYEARTCNCGSGEDSWWENDAQGIPLCRVCDQCREEKLGRYRPCILSGYDQSDVNEPIDPD